MRRVLGPASVHDCLEIASGIHIWYRCSKVQDGISSRFLILLSICEEYFSVRHRPTGMLRSTQRLSAPNVEGCDVFSRSHGGDPSDGTAPHCSPTLCLFRQARRPPAPQARSL